jgi:aromatic ring-opening dioxygenase catalytic subunit (LigB family)
LQAPFIVGVADEYVPLGDMGIPRSPFRGSRAFADAFVRFAARSGFDLARAEEIRPDHGLVFPNLIVNPGNRIAVLPLYIGVANDMPPSPMRVWMLAQCLRQFTDTERPDAERVVVLGTGGLSHWLCEAEQGRVNEEFDRLVIDKLTSRAGHELAELSAEDIRGQAGRSGLEMLHWLFAAGTAAGLRGELVFYEPMPEWITGMGGIAFAR